MLRSEYKVNVEGEIIGQTDNAADAVMAWNQLTYNRTVTKGGIEVQTFNGDVMVRDGWLLHVEDGRVYLSSSSVYDPNVAFERRK